MRKNGADFPDIKRTTYQWFLQHLADDQKVHLSNYGGAGGWFMSPEAGELLARSKTFWTLLAQAEVSAGKTRQAAEMSLEAGTAPAEFADGRVVMPEPVKPVSEVFCWKPDFAGENYQAVLWYRDLLPVNHRSTTEDTDGYEAKTMSPEAAELYRRHRNFWLAKYWGPIKAKRAADKFRNETAKQTVEKAASKAGLSKVELNAKVGRLATLVKEGNLKLASEMIINFEDAWLFDSLLAGTSINEKGCLVPGKVLKRFEDHAKAVGLLALAHAPVGTALDPSLTKSTPIDVRLTDANLEVLAEHVSPHFPKLIPEVESHLAFYGLTTLSGAAAELLSKHKGDLDLNCLETLSDAAVKLLSKHEGRLKLNGLTTLSDAGAESLAKRRGCLNLKGLKTLSDAAAESLVKHKGEINLDGLATLSDAAAESLAKKKGRLNLKGLTTLSDSAAKSLSEITGRLFLYGKVKAQVAKFKHKCKKRV